MRLSQKVSNRLSGDWWLAPFCVVTFFAATRVVMAFNISTAIDSFNKWLGVPYGCFPGLWINIQQWIVIAVDTAIIFIVVASVWVAVMAICLFAVHLLLNIKKLLLTPPLSNTPAIKIQ